MKIGLNNIFTSFLFIMMLLCSGTLTYFSYDGNVFTSDLFFVGKIIMGFMILLFIGTFFYFLYKFRILIIKENRIISIFPFRFLIEKIELNKITNLKWSNWLGAKGTVYRLAEIKGGKVKISISDREFENFDYLINEISKNHKRGKLKVDLEQAKGNISSMKFNIYLLIGLLIFLIGNTIFNSGFHLIIILFLITNCILIYASYKRKIKYDRIIKNGLQHRV